MILKLLVSLFMAFGLSRGDGEVSVKNSTQETIAASAFYLGAWDTSRNFPVLTISVLADQDSEVCVWFSHLAINAEETLCFDVSAGVGESHTYNTGLRFFRVKVTNGSAISSAEIRVHSALSYFTKHTNPANQSIDPDVDTTVVRTIPEESDIGMGRRDDYILVQKFGHNTDVDTGTVPEDIWTNGGAYTGFPSETENVEVLSSDANDTAAGTGCRTVFISGLDANFSIQSETISLDGVTPVDSGGTYSRVNRIYCATSGSGTTNAGTITVRHTTTTANVFGEIVAGKGQSEIGCYTVPAGYTGYIKHYRYSLYDTTANRATVEFYIVEETGNTKQIRPQSVSTDTFTDIKPYGGLAFPEKTDGCGRVIAVDNSNANINFSFEMVLVKN